MKLATCLLGAGFAATVLAPAALAAGAPMGATSIAGLFPGYYEAQVQGYTLLISATTDGSLHGKAFGREDTGRWQIVGDRLCVSWSQWTKGKNKCGDIVRNGSWYVATNAAEGEVLRFTAIKAGAFENMVATATPQAAADKN
jgi:hypothetical protein